MRRIIVILILNLFALSVFPQQLMLTNHYYIDPYSINPSFVGQENETFININYRKQWAGFSKSPAVYYLNAYSLLGEKPPQSFEPMSVRISDPSKYESLFKLKEKKIKHGLGGCLQSMNYGQIRRVSADLTYAVHLRLGKNWNLSTGLSLGFLNYSFSDKDLVLLEPDDVTYHEFIGQNQSTSFMNMNLGLMLSSEKLQIGYSANQIFRNQIWFVSNSAAMDLQVHHYIHALYAIKLNNALSIKPGFLFRLCKHVPLSFDVSTTFDFYQKYWGGVIYRFNSAIAFMCGMKYQNMRFGYSFDLSTNALINYNSGSHELIMGLVF
jgi:type IX secretion system PorP/SprF family membrane protein